MGKTNKKRKRNHALFHAVKARMNGEAVVETPPIVAQEPTVTIAVDGSDTISDSDLRTTLSTLERLAGSPTLFGSKRFKDLRRTLHPLVLAQLQSYDKGIDYQHRVTTALQHRHWSDALAALQACQDFEQWPKQGTVQRWVRECMGAGACQMQLLQAIMKLSSADGIAGDGNKHDPAEALAEHLAANEKAKDGVAILDGWKWWSNHGKDNDGKTDDGKKENGASKEEEKSMGAVESVILYREAAAERTPPNHYDLLLHSIPQPNIITWAIAPPPTAAHPIPFLAPPSRVIANVFTQEECRQIRHIMTTLGYRPDHPVTLENPTGIDSCEWMVEEEIVARVLERVQPHLPATLNLPRGGGSHNQVQLHAINPRWRGFRYGPDCVYRPHLDGSWPQSYVTPEGTYVCPKQSVVKSYLTFLIYLNDDFEGGETRFYLPQGIARGIVPKTGSVLVFPQGNLASLIHEGSQVTRGVKYVVRTDVLYRPVIAAMEAEQIPGDKSLQIPGDPEETVVDSE